MIRFFLKYLNDLYSHRTLLDEIQIFECNCVLVFLVTIIRDIKKIVQKNN